MQATETNETTYTVGDVTYTVGQDIELTAEMRELLNRLKMVTGNLNGAHTEVVTRLLDGDDNVEEISDTYINRMMASTDERVFLNARIHRQLIADVGGFLPVQVNVADEPRITVRQMGPNERLSVDLADISKELKVSTLAIPMKQFLTDFDVADSSADTETLQAQRGVIFSGTVDTDVFSGMDLTNADGVTGSDLYARVMKSQEMLTAPTAPSLVLVLGNGRYAAVGLDQEMTQTLSVTSLCAHLAEMVADGNPADEIEVTLVTAFVMVEPPSGEGQDPVFTLNLGVNQGKGDASSRCHLRIGPDGSVVQFMDSEAIAANMAAMAAEAQGANG